MFFPDLAQLRDGNEEAWRNAFLILWPVAVAAARRPLQTIDPGAVEDVAIVAVRQVAEKVRDGAAGSESELRALTVVIARRGAVSQARKCLAQRRGEGRTESIENHAGLPSSGPDPFEEVEAADLARLLSDLVLAQLGTRQRDLLEAFYLQGLTYAEIAARFGLPAGSVGVELMRSRQILQNFLRSHPTLLKEFRETPR